MYLSILHLKKKKNKQLGMKQDHKVVIKCQSEREKLANIAG